LQKNSSPVHILVNNTGGPSAGKAIDANAHEFTAAFQAHLICNQILTQSLIEGMKAEKIRANHQHHFDFGQTADSGLGVSNTIRGAVASWAKTLAGELGEFGITVNNVLPGFTKTQRLEAIIANKANKSGDSIQKIAAEMQSETPARRFAEASEIANAAAFLASPAASYINGVNLPVDGGRTACL
jgi:3-oxoacyl-[acyl-carrier protein] reductase